MGRAIRLRNVLEFRFRVRVRVMGGVGASNPSRVRKDFTATTRSDGSEDYPPDPVLAVGTPVAAWGAFCAETLLLDQPRWLFVAFAI